MVGMIAKSFGIDPRLASMATGAVTKMFLQKSTPQNASNILQSLPRNITEQFNEEEKKQFTSNQENLDRYDIVKKLSEVTGIKDIDKLDQLTNLVLDNIKQNTQINTADGIDKEELFIAMRDLYRSNKQV